MKFKNALILAVFLLFAIPVFAQDYPTVETAPAFMYIRTAPLLNGSNNFNCVGGGGTLAYNFSSLLGLAADLGGCKVLNNNNTILGNTINQLRKIDDAVVAIRRRVLILLVELGVRLSQ